MTRRLLAAVAAIAMLGLAARAARAAECRAPLESWGQIDLYFGRSFPGGTISEEQWQGFLAEIVTPHFPDGLSALDVYGQYRNQAGLIAKEPSKLLILLVPDAAAVAGRVDEVIDAYKTQFQQESVLRTEHEVCLAF